ncbi:MAG TPA: T9SS type A sorting domain-containing protein, partial [Bacteroidia bacterium]|nr:T9SS type A sorting domain-containing protein [Bacteroidia bacterium]
MSRIKNQLQISRQNVLTFKNILICFILAILFNTENAFSQAASATWALSANAVAATSGNVTAGNQTGGSGIGTMSYGAANGVTSLNWGSASQNVNDYYQFTISPTSGNGLTVTSISTTNNTSSGGVTNVLLQYSLSASFTSPVTIGSPAPTGTSSFSSLTINAANGQTIYVRMFAWGASNETNKTFSCKNFIISGTTLTCPSSPAAGSNSPVCAGSNINLTSSATGTSLTYSWSGPNSFSSSSQNPTISSSTTAAAGTYTITVSNACGSVSTTTNVAVNSLPSIGSQPSDQTVCSGNSSIFTVSASGTGLTYQWRKGTTNLVNEGNISGATSPTLTINPSVTGDAAANYNVVVSGTCSPAATSNNVSLTVNTAPAISSQPAVSQTTCSGTSVSFSVTASGSGLTYQWYKAATSLTNGGNISGATSSTLTLNPVATGDAASNYNVVISGPCTPAVTSDNSSLVVNSSSAAISGTNTICSGSDGTVHVVFTGTAPWNYTISDGSQNVSGTTSNSVEDILIPAPAEGNHSFTVTSLSDANCTGTFSGAASVTVNPVPVISMITSTSPLSEACNGTVAQLTANIANGFTYNYTWNTGVNQSVAKFSNSAGGPFVNGTFQSASNTVYVQFGSLIGSSGYNVCVEISNACGNSGYSCKWIRGIMSTPGNISGSPIACSNQTGANYSVVNTVSTAVYNWTFSAPGATFTGQGTNNVSVNFPVFTTGQLCVTAALSCGGSSTSAPRCLAITHTTGQPSSIIGPSKVCPGSANVLYSVSSLPGAASYNWTVPSGANIVETPPYGNSIHVNFPGSYSGAPPIVVYGVSACGIQSTGRSKTVGSHVPNIPGSITGPTGNICNSTVQYSVPNVSGATGYAWSIPAGATNVIGQGSTSIQFNVPNSFTNGMVSVIASTNACTPGNSPPRNLNISGAPATPGIITLNPPSWCVGQTINASVPTVSPLPSYNWTYVNGTIDAGQGTNNVDVVTISGQVTLQVRAVNTCGVSGNRVLHTNASCREEKAAVLSANNRLTVSPNPAHNFITVSIDAKQHSGMTIVMRDLSGRAVLSEKVTATAGLNTYEINISRLAKGIYSMESDYPANIQKAKVVIE